MNKIAQAPVVKAEPGKAKLLNANARMGRHHKHYRHHRHHKHIGLHKTHAKHIAIKHVTPVSQTRLNPIRRRAFRPHCPARLANDTTSPRAICFANGRGLARAQFFESESEGITELRIPFSRQAV